MADYLQGLRQVVKPEDVPATAHWAILVFDTVTTGTGQDDYDMESVHRYYVFQDQVEWETALSGMQMDFAYYRKPFVGLAVSAKARFTTKIEIE